MEAPEWIFPFRGILFFKKFSMEKMDDANQKDDKKGCAEAGRIR